MEIFVGIVLCVIVWGCAFYVIYLNILDERKNNRQKNDLQSKNHAEKQEAVINPYVKPQQCVSEKVIEEKKPYSPNDEHEKKIKQLVEQYIELRKNLKKTREEMPYPDIDAYAVEAVDYEDALDLQFKKRQNEPYEKEIVEIEKEMKTIKNNLSKYGINIDKI